MKKVWLRASTLCLLISLLISSSVPAFAASVPDVEPQDSKYFLGKNITVLSTGNGKLNIDVSVKAKSIMTEIGTTQISVYEKQSDGNYREVHTYTRYNQTGMILSNRSSASISIVYYGTSGKYYYVTAACFCKNSTGSETTWVGSSAVKA